MTVKQNKNGKWLVQIDRKDIPRIRKSFNDEKAAEIFEREYLAAHQIKQNQFQDPRTLIELINLWHKYHGINLAAPEHRYRALVSLANGLGNPQACRLTPEKFVDFRFKRISGGLSEKTFNNLHGYLSAVFRKLRKLKVINFENPIDEVDFIKIHERQLSYLSKPQIEELLGTIEEKTINPSTWFVTQLCLRTGARWGEVESLRRKQLHHGRVTYEFTKSKRTRTIPIDKRFYTELMAFTRGKVPEQRIFTNCMGSFTRAMERTEITLPKGQNTHILRHTFASHFVMNGGNILTLQKILGHADIKMTMRYAHLAPDHLHDAVTLNPIDTINGGDLAVKTTKKHQKPPIENKVRPITS